jgi:hypothetical protein
MKKYLIGALVLIAAVAMIKTVPDKKAHKKAMMEAVKEYVDEEAAKRGIGDGILSKLGKNIVNKTVEVALNSKLEVDNYLLFNTTHVELDDEVKTLSLGILGHVFTFDKEMLRDALETSAKEKQEQKDERKTAKEAAKEAKKLEKQLKKEQKKREKAARKEQKRREKEARKEQKRREKEAKEKNKK